MPKGIVTRRTKAPLFVSHWRYSQATGARLRRIAPRLRPHPHREETPVIGGKGRVETVLVEEIRLRLNGQPADRPGGRVVEFDVNKPERVRSRSFHHRFSEQGDAHPVVGDRHRHGGQPARGPRDNVAEPPVHVSAQHDEAAIGRKLDPIRVRWAVNLLNGPQRQRPPPAVGRQTHRHKDRLADHQRCRRGQVKGNAAGVRRCLVEMEPKFHGDPRLPRIESRRLAKVTAVQGDGLLAGIADQAAGEQFSDFLQLGRRPVVAQRDPHPPGEPGRRVALRRQLLDADHPADGRSGRRPQPRHGPPRQQGVAHQDGNPDQESQSSFHVTSRWSSHYSAFRSPARDRQRRRPEARRASGRRRGRCSPGQETSRRKSRCPGRRHTAIVARDGPV